MSAQTSMLHARVEDQLKTQASDALAGVVVTLFATLFAKLTQLIVPQSVYPLGMGKQWSGSLLL